MASGTPRMPDSLQKTLGSAPSRRIAGVRIAEMVKHEGHLGAGGDGVGGGRQHFGWHDDVVAESSSADSGQAAVHRRPAQPVGIGLDEYRMPDPAQVRTIG